ncbi:MAG: carbonic anhydrase family protein [Chloroflexi bacterium]|nr:carbonic anhydrase family protein [Chloroflexota bacterium]MDA1227017.1 carbonic anhydrase family protein [Chloroflexota bacterium]
MISDQNLRTALFKGKGYAIALSALAFALLLVLSGCGTSASAADSSDAESGARTRTRVSRVATSDTHAAPASTDHAAPADSHAAPATGHAAPASTDHAAPATGHAAPASTDHGSAAPHWAYEGDLGPSKWGDLADEFIACKAGTSQSPIDIAGSAFAQPASIQFNYNDVPLSILNNGHTLQVNYAPGSSIVIDHEQYELLQFHFHTPSEHQVSSQNYPMEGHLVHKSASGELAVVGVFIEEGHSNPFFQSLVANLPHGAGEVKEVHGVNVNVESMLPHDREIYTYSGSLTTPPCSEGVNWNVMSTPIEMSGDQISAFNGILGHNNRPVQPLHARLISGGSTGDAHGVAPDHGDTTVSNGDHGDGPPHWTYEGNSGPNYWGDLADDYIACKTGVEQSPIDIDSRFTVGADNSVFTNYGDTVVTILNNGHTIQINYDSGSVAYLDGGEYDLLQFHFHTPSENSVDGGRYPMEMHLVHKNAGGGLGVIGVLFESGEENPLFAKFWDFLPREEGNVASDLRISITDILPSEAQYFAFDGSLTTPPCSEGVKWFVVQEPVQASKAQMDKFMSIFGGNARPVQPLNSRTIGEF